MEDQREREKRQLDTQLAALEYEIMNSNCAPESPIDIQDYENKKCFDLFAKHRELFEKRYPNFVVQKGLGSQNTGPSIGPAQKDYGKEEYTPLPRPMEMLTGPPSKFLTPEYKEMKEKQVQNIYKKLGITNEDARIVAGFIPIVGDILDAEDCMKQILLLNSYYEKDVEVSEEEISELEDDVIFCLGLIIVPGVVEASLKHFIRRLRYGARSGKDSMQAIEDSSSHLREEAKAIEESAKTVRVTRKSSIPAKSSKIKSSAKPHAEHFKDHVIKYIDSKNLKRDGKLLLKEIDEVADIILDSTQELTIHSAKKAENVLARIISPRGSGFYSGEDLFDDILFVMTTAKDTAKTIRQNKSRINASRKLLERHFCNIINTLNFKRHMGEDNE